MVRLQFLIVFIDIRPEHKGPCTLNSHTMRACMLFGNSFLFTCFKQLSRCVCRCVSIVLFSFSFIIFSHYIRQETYENESHTANERRCVWERWRMYSMWIVYFSLYRQLLQWLCADLFRRERSICITVVTRMRTRISYWGETRFW